MGGSDTIRGITYQHACAIAASLDVLEDSTLGAIRIESAQDVIDFDVVDRDDKRVRVAQVKTRAEPGSFSAPEIASVLKRWSALPGEKPETYEFVSDGQLNPKAARVIKEPVELLRGGAARALVQPLFEEAGIGSLPDDLLKRVRIRTRNADTSSLLDSAMLRLLRLAEMSGQITQDEASSRIDSLFREMSIRAGSTNEHERLFRRQQLALVLRVSLPAIDSGQQWTEELAIRYRKWILSNVGSNAVVLNVSTSSLVHPALQLSVREPKTDQTYPVDSITDVFERCAITGPTGAGKSTALNLIAQSVARGGGLPIVVSPSRYVGGTLQNAIRRCLESGAEVVLAYGAVTTVLHHNSTVLLLDGLTERPGDEINLLRRDLLDLAASSPSLRIVVSGRRPESIRLPDVAPLILNDLDEAQRREIVAQLLGDRPESASIQEVVEQSLGDAATNPLLFTMAVSLRETAKDISTRAALYQGMVRGMWARHPQDEAEHLIEEVLSRVARRFVDRGQFRTNVSDWLSLASDGLLGANAGHYDIGASSAQSVLEAASRVGLVTTPPFTRDVVFVHDSFRDYFAAQTYKSVGLPSVPTAEYEPSIELFCEQEGVPAELVALACSSNPILACRIARLDKRKREGRDAEVTADIVRAMIAHHLGRPVPLGINADALGVRVCWTQHHSWIALTNTSTAEEVAGPADLRVPPAPLIVVTEEGELGPLALATYVWRWIAREALRFAIDEPSWVRTEGYDLDELISHLRSHAERRQAALRSIAMTALPSISARLLALVGPTGLQARVAVSPMPGSAKHLMHYRYEHAPLNVVPDVDLGKSDASQFWSQTSAERYLQITPAYSAERALAQAFQELVSPKQH